MDDVDKWGRPVVELIQDDGWNLGLELVRAGFAAVYPKYCDDQLYYAAEDQARAAKVGIGGRKGCNNGRGCGGNEGEDLSP